MSTSSSLQAAPAASTTRTYMVPLTNLDIFIAVAAAQQRIAVRSGFPVPQWREVRRVAGEGGQYAEIELSGAGPFAGGYQLVGVIEHEPDGVGGYANRVRPLPGARDAIPAEARTAAPRCDHCGTRRQRSRTFLAYHLASGELVWCGADCLADLTGITGAAALVLWLIDLDTALDAAATARARQSPVVVSGRRSLEDWIHGSVTIRAREYVAAVLAAIHADGWVSATATRGTPTWRAAATTEATPDDLAAAEQVIAWSRSGGVAIASEFQAAAVAALAADDLDVRQRSLVAALVWRWVEQERGSAVAPAAPPANHTRALAGLRGEVDITGRCLERQIAGAPEPAAYHLIETESGHLVAWPTRAAVLEPGKVYQLTGRVKEIQRRADGAVIVVLSRVKVANRKQAAARSVSAIGRYLAQAA